MAEGEYSATHTSFLSILDSCSCSGSPSFIMKRFFAICSVIFLLGSILCICILPAGAVGSVTLTNFDNILSWTLVEDNDDPFVSLIIQYLPYGEQNWINIESIDVSTFDPQSYIIPENLWVNYNYFRLRAETDVNYTTSNVIQLSRQLDTSFTLTVDEGGNLKWDYMQYDVTLHYNYWKNFVAFHPLGTYPQTELIDSLVTTVVVPTRRINSNGDHLADSVPEFSTSVYATCTINGVTYYSNTVWYYGWDILGLKTTPPDANLGLYVPNDTDVNRVTELIYSGAKDTIFYTYAFSALCALVPFIFVGWLIKT